MIQELKENELLEEDDFPSDEQDDVRESKETVLEIKLYSWTTPIIGLVMLVIGLFAGYLGRPLISHQFGSISSVSATPAPQVAGASVPGQAQGAPNT